jgi:hypothetical protein
MPDQHVYRVRAVSTGWAGADGLNQFYFLVDDTMESDHAVAALDVVTRVHGLFTIVNEAYPTSWFCQVSGTVDVINTDNSDLVESVVVATPAAVEGNGGTDFGPQAAMICANLVTTSIIDGHRVRGREFFGPLRDHSDPDGTPPTASVGMVHDGVTAILGGTLTAVPLVVWSRKRPVSLRHPTGLGGSAHIVSAVTVKDSYAILRSRRA